MTITFHYRNFTHFWTYMQLTIENTSDTNTLGRNTIYLFLVYTCPKNISFHHCIYIHMLMQYSKLGWGVQFLSYLENRMLFSLPSEIELIIKLLTMSTFSSFFFYFLYKILRVSGFLDILICCEPTFFTWYRIQLE